MKQFKYLIIIGLAGLLFNTSKAQFIDKYGLRAGVGLSNFHYDYENGSEWFDDKVGFAIYLNAEKKLNKYFSIRPEIGYIQKGYNFHPIRNELDGSTTQMEVVQVNFNDLSLSLDLKINLFESKFKPYVIMGLRGDYMLGFKIIANDSTVNWESTLDPIIDSYNKFILGGVVGIGCEFDNLLYLELEYNPDFSTYKNEDDVKLIGRYFGLSLGININKLVN